VSRAGINREEVEVGVSAVAAPVFDHRARVIAAISITGYAHRLDLERLAPALLTAARSLSRELSRETANGTLRWPPEQPQPAPEGGEAGRRPP
jgi:hypothetical protein